MSVYRSRYLRRLQTTVAGKIENVERYDRYYDIAYDAIQDRIFPSTALPVGALVVRGSDHRYDARVIPPGSSTKITNRFSGLRLDGRAGQGALYVGTIAGVLREHTHYSLPGSKKPPDRIWRPLARDATAEFMHEQRTGKPPLDPNSKFFLYRVNTALYFADLRITALVSLMSRLRRMAGTRRYGIDDAAPADYLAKAPGDPKDYSASRGIADAVFDSRGRSGLAGVCAFSSRADTDSGLVGSSEGDATGGLIYAIFGADLSAVTALTPVPKSPGTLAFDTFGELNDAVQSS